MGRLCQVVALSGTDQAIVAHFGECNSYRYLLLVNGADYMRIDLQQGGITESDKRKLGLAFTPHTPSAHGGAELIN